MLRLDKNDPLDRMVLQELDGEPVPFDVWLDAMDELDSEPDCAQILQERELCAEDVLRDAETYRADFHTRLSKWKLPLDNRFELCSVLLVQAKRNPCTELLRIYCEVLCDPGFLLNRPQQSDGYADRSNDEEQTILQYLDFCQERDNLLRTMAQRQELGQKFSEVTKQNRNPWPVDCDTKRSYEIASCFTALFDLTPKENGDILLNNLSEYIQIAAASPALKAIEPLLLFRLLTRHKSRMCSVPNLSVSLGSLWKRDSGKIDHNNGRNFKQYRLYLQFFTDLCRIYQGDMSVDFPLCWYGLDQLTVLGDFYREHIATSWTYADSENNFPFIPTVEELVDDALFSCFEDRYKDNILLADGDITFRELQKFQERSDPPVVRAFEKISDYMNEHLFDLSFQAEKAESGELKVICRDILEQSKIRYQPESPRETELFLAAINNGLMDGQDWIANCFLSQAGHALLGEPTEISIQPE